MAPLVLSGSYSTYSNSVPVVYPETPGLSIHQKHLDDNACLSRLPRDWQLSIHSLTQLFQAGFKLLNYRERKMVEVFNQYVQAHWLAVH